jgi:hypothetical protein
LLREVHLHDMKRRWAGPRKLAIAVLAVVLGGSFTGGCGTDIRPAESTSSGTLGTGGGGGAGGGAGSGGGEPAKAEKVDILLVLDNSRGMADKQAVFALAVPDLVSVLVNPRCLDDSGAPAQVQPNGPLESCPDGTAREFAPVVDLHLGIISSSLGGHGADACPTDGFSSGNDRGHLLARTDPSVPTADIPTYQNKGFLAWDPGQALSPPGEADIDSDTAVDMNATALVPSLRDMVAGVGQVGCGFESQLESWYRFLIDPEPYETIAIQDGRAVQQGTDATLLAQRRDFLRSDSLLAIVVLSDENDCSIVEGDVFFLAAQLRTPGGGLFHLWRARAECASDPNDACCRSCNQTQTGCPVDPSCFDPDGAIRVLSNEEDQPNLRCFDQKRRFGFDFLYPTARYSSALRDRTIANRQGDLVPNPIFADLDPNDGNTTVRSPDLVLLAGIVGVPWQDIARQDAAGAPDLAAGLDAAGRPAGGFKDADELSQPNGPFASTWDIILGDPAQFERPGDPHQIESVAPRSGTNPITGTPIAPPGAANGTDPINGHEYTIASQNDLQYACIFPLPSGAAKDCSNAGDYCECLEPENDNPLCEPAGGGRTLQVGAKAYPGLRQLSVLKSLGQQGVVASVCPKQLDAPGAPDFGYRPAVRALVERMAPHF